MKPICQWVVLKRGPTENRVWVEIDLISLIICYFSGDKKDTERLLLGSITLNDATISCSENLIIIRHTVLI